MFSKRIKSENCLLSTLLSRIVTFGACLFVFISPLTVCAQSGFDFSKVAPTGQRLYYYIEGSNNVVVTYPLDVDEDDDDFDNDYWGNYTVPSGSMTIPSTVTNNGVTYTVTGIDGHTFQGCSGLTSVVIPNTVTHIGLEAFYWCTGLTSITIGDSVNQIGSSAFYHCTGLQTVTIPSSVEEIGSDAFSWCNLSSLTFNADSLTSDLFCHYHNNISNITIGNNVKVLPNGLCSGHDSLSSIFIPASVKIIGYQAFTNNSLSSIVVSGGNMVYDSRNNCNAVIRKSDSVIVAGCRNTVIPNTVKTIGRYSLNCKRLSTITIPNSVNKLEDHAFYKCINLYSISIPNSVSIIGEYAFSECSNLHSVILPDSLDQLNNCVFVKVHKVVDGI